MKWKKKRKEMIYTDYILMINVIYNLVNRQIASLWRVEAEGHTDQTIEQILKSSWHGFHNYLLLFLLSSPSIFDANRITWAWPALWIQTSLMCIWKKNVSFCWSKEGRSFYSHKDWKMNRRKKKFDIKYAKKKNDS